MPPESRTRCHCRALHTTASSCTEEPPQLTIRKRLSVRQLETVGFSPPGHLPQLLVPHYQRNLYITSARTEYTYITPYTARRNHSLARHINIPRSYSLSRLGVATRSRVPHFEIVEIGDMCLKCAPIELGLAVNVALI